MNTDVDTEGARSVGIAFVQCFDATTFCRIVHMTEGEERGLRGLLAALCRAGFILRAGYADSLPGSGYSEVVEDLRQSIGAHIVDAFLTAGDDAPAGREPAPAAVMPVWAFEPEGTSDDVLISSARLWGVDLLVEALRVEDDDDPKPVVSVGARFRRWVDAAGGCAALKTTRLPGREGPYVVFAAAAPA
jgi:hypothetical protein